MRHPRTTIAVIAVAAAAGVSGIAAAATTGGSPTGGSASSKAVAVAVPPIVQNVPRATSATIHAATATVGGKAESILENAQGLPLYFYKPDTASRSFVSGGL